jgi:hypothetical protein
LCILDGREKTYLGSDEEFAVDSVHGGFDENVWHK